MIEVNLLVFKKKKKHLDLDVLYYDIYTQIHSNFEEPLGKVLFVRPNFLLISYNSLHGAILIYHSL